MKPESTERVSLAEVRMRKRAWQPFNFRGLPAVSRAHARDSDRLNVLLSLGFQNPGGLGKQLASRLAEVLETSVKLNFLRATVVPLNEAASKISAHAYLGALSTSPHNKSGLLEVDLETAQEAIDVLLGGGSERPELRPLTEIEEGVLGYLVLEGLRSLAGSAASFLPKLHLESVCRSGKEAMASWTDGPSVLALELRIRLGEKSGQVRLYFPSSLLEQVELSAEAKATLGPKRMLLRSHLNRFRGVRVHLRAEVATAEISPQVLRSVRPRDVILIDECFARPDKGQGGSVRLRVGSGQKSLALAELKLDKGNYFARIERFALGEEPRMGESMEEADHPNGEEPSENVILEEAPNGEGGDLLNDVPLQIAVELARLPMTADEVASLRTGQVLDLKRGPNQPVDLSINGRMVARGELVEVDGNLGVRILSLNE